MTIIGGGGGWSTLVKAVHYHNDAGISARSVAEDAARLASETLGGFEPEQTSIGGDYQRQSGAASRVLEDVIGSAQWWVDFEGLTQVGIRETGEIPSNAYQFLSWNPDQEMAVLAVDSLSDFLPGKTFEADEAGTLTVREMRLEVAPESARVYVWTGGLGRSRGRLGAAAAAFVQRVSTGARLFGLYEFRVTGMNAERVDLQVVESASGLADMAPISMAASPGYHGLLTDGALVYVQFVNGVRTRPVIVGFGGKDTNGHSPQEIEITAETEIRLGDASATEPVVLNGPNSANLERVYDALNVFALASPVVNDGGKALQTAFTGKWGLGTATLDDSASTKVKAV